jgi:predicted RNase H-like HicB family nuclease
MKTYRFKAELEQDTDGRWSSWVDALPGCAAWGHSEEEALSALKDAVQAYVEDMIEAGDELLSDKPEVIEAPVVSITV